MNTNFTQLKIQIGRKCVFTCRFIVALLGSCCYFVLGSQRMNISIAIVSMVNRDAQEAASDSPYSNLTDECFSDGNFTEETKEFRGEFDWSPELENLVLASSFAGYMLSLTPGGLLADAFGAKTVLTFGIFISSVSTFLSPWGCRWSVYCLIVFQFIKGLGQGVIQPALGCLMASWFPKEELSSLSAVIYAGGRAGNFITGMVSGLLCELKFLGGWPLVFYVFGILGCLSCVLLYFCLYETPADHPRIDPGELAYVSKTTKSACLERLPTPWFAMFKSAPTWALLASMFGLYWYPMYFTSVHAVFLGNVLKFPVSQIGIMTSSPYILQALVTMATGSFSDWLYRNKYASLTVIRKANNITSCLIISLSLMGACMVGCDRWMSVFFFTLAVGGSGFTNTGCYVVPVDMTPNFAGTLTGLGTTAGFLSATMIPLITGRFLRDEPTLAQWRKVFLVSITVTMTSGIVFLLFGSAEVQSWNNPNSSSDKKRISIVTEPSSLTISNNKKEPEDTHYSDVLYRTHM